jgi:fido (protein-threonine AMPylation protein)
VDWTNSQGKAKSTAPQCARPAERLISSLDQESDGPFRRAAFQMFLISEVHPFRDGNGRMGRIFMNAELVARVDFSDFETAWAQLDQANAFASAAESRLELPPAKRGATDPWD